MTKKLESGVVFGPLLVFALSCVVFWLTTRVIVMPPAWRTFEFCQYAEIGGNIATEGLFDTRLVEPMALAYIDTYRTSSPGRRWPVINRYPLPCFVIAGLMKLIGVGDMAAAWSNGLAIGGLAALAYSLARRWYGPRWAALTALLVLTNPAFYGYFILLGTPDVWFALLFALELLVFCRLSEGRWLGKPGRSLWGTAMLAGLLAGLAFLSRFNVLIFLVIQAIVLLAHNRFVEVVLACVVFATVAAPLLIYNLHHFGRPIVSIYSAWNLLDGIGAYQLEPWLYYQVPDVPVELRNHFRGFAAKFFTNLAFVVPERVWSLWHFFLVLPVAIAGVAVFLLKAAPNEEPARPRRFLLWSAGLFSFQLVLFCALRLELEDRLSPHHGRYFFWFAVPALLLAFGALERLRRKSRLSDLLTVLMIAGQLTFYGLTWRGWIEQNAKGTNFGRDPIRRMLAAMVPDGRAIGSNQPPITTWYSGRKSISLPADPDELSRLNRQSPTPVDYIMIDLNGSWIQLDHRWEDIASLPMDGSVPWERIILVDYEFVIEPARTRPLRYVLLRRRAVPPSRLERTFRNETGAWAR
jgi:hypothetical protein